MKLLKYYLDIDKAEQKRRLKDRKADPLKQWKVSPIDDQALKYWKAYSLARNEMLARLNIIKDLLSRLHYKGKDKRLIRPDRKIVFACDVSMIKNGQLAK